MEAVKKTFGVLLLATALWLSSPLIPASVQMFAWALLLIIPAMYLHALDPLPPATRGWARFWKGIGIVLLLAGAALLIGALGGSRDPLQPLSGFRAQATGASLGSSSPRFERVADLAELESRLSASKRPVLLDFYADWCVSCKEMERDTFSAPAVQRAMQAFTLLKADVTANTPADQALLARFSLYGPPGIIFFGPAGKEIPELRVIGFQDAASFASVLAKAQAARR